MNFKAFDILISKAFLFNDLMPNNKPFGINYGYFHWEDSRKGFQK